MAVVPSVQLSIGGVHPCLLLSPQDSPEAGEEREEEQAFLVSLYKFMKERHTPIERVPHLGFKQSTFQGEVDLRGQPGDLPRDNRQGTSAPGDPGSLQPPGGYEKDASLKAKGWSWVPILSS